MIALAEHQPDAGQLAAEWKDITGDSHIVDVRPISQADPVSGFIEVFKYAVKFSDQPPADTVHAWLTLARKRLLGSAGCFRGVEVPESLLDDPEGLDELPYATLFYRFLRGRGYAPHPLPASPTRGGEAAVFCKGKKRPPLAAIPPAPAVRGNKRSAVPSPC